MDVKKDIEKLCLAHGNSYSRDVVEVWEKLIEEDIEEKQYELQDIQITLHSLLRICYTIKTFGHIHESTKEYARARISAADIQCPMCHQTINIPASTAIQGLLKTGCACGQTKQDIINHYKNLPIVRNLWRASTSLGQPNIIPPDIDTLPSTKDVEYYD